MKRRMLLMLLSCICCVFAWSQTRQVTGRVVSDSARQGLAGVNVTIRGTSTSTATSNEGRYSINVPDRNDVVLVFSSVGFRRQEVNVGTRSTVDVTLAEETSALNDIVVIGYTTVRRRDLTGSVASTSARE